MNFLRIEIKWASIFIVMMLLWMLMERLTGLHSIHIDKHPIYTNFVAIPAIIIYILALRDKRISFYNGRMSYLQGFKSGLIISVIVGLLTPLLQLITSLVISPNYFNNVIEYSVSNGLMSLEAAEQYFNLKNYIIQSSIGAPIMGILTTLVVAFFSKRK